jgi:hypothetical protein
VTKEAIKEVAQAALKTKPDCNALAVSMETLNQIHDLLEGDPDYEFCDDNDVFESRLFGKPLIMAENLKDGLIAPVNIADAGELPPLEEELN